MSAPKFTHGPWNCFYKHKYDEWHVSLPMAGSSMKLALCPDGIQSGNREADAHLIAAAPDMFAALNGAMVIIDLLPWPNELGSEVSAALSKRRDAIIAAISKANPHSLSSTPTPTDSDSPATVFPSPSSPGSQSSGAT